MPIRVKCEKCKKTLSVKDHLAGKKIKCPLCQTVVTVPADANGVADAAPGVPRRPRNRHAAGAEAQRRNRQDQPRSRPPGNRRPMAPIPRPTNRRTTVAKAKPKPESNGALPPKSGEKTNGKAPPPAPAPIELPPENVEEEALSALADVPPPPEETQAPKTIFDFTCEYCEAELHLPLDLGGKQTQCPNKECRRIIKVPLPKIEGPKDWRKMDRKGPAAALVSQPERCPRRRFCKGTAGRHFRKAPARIRWPRPARHRLQSRRSGSAMRPSG